MPEETKFRERRSKGKMKNNLEKVNFLENKNAIRERGITLIALVVTIIVLLILASISISVILGDNGLIDMAREAGRKTNEAVEKEQGDIANLTNELKDYVNGTTGEKTLVQMFRDGELQVGDYLNYENPAEGSYTAKADKTGMKKANEDGKDLGITGQTFSVKGNDLHWRILGIDEATGGLKLISGRPIKREGAEDDPYFYMYGANAYLNGEEELNNIAKIFKNEKYAQDVRSVTMKDIDEAVGIKTKDDIKRVNLGYNPEYGSTQYGEPYKFDKQYTPESWLNNEQQTTVTGTVDGYYYSINDTGEPTVKVDNKTLSDMLFDNVEYLDNGVSGANYWLASRGVYASSDYAGFGLGSVNSREGITDAGAGDMFYSDDGLEGCCGFAVRPIVILKSDLTAKDLQKINQIEEERWEYGELEPQ